MSDSPIDEREHIWFRERLDAYALGLLDEAEEHRFLAHAGSCATCGDALRAYQENVARIAREGHIPARLLARWDRARGRLRGMARRMVREHLESCPECRQDLEAIGFRPELEVVAELEGEADPDSRRALPPPPPAREIRLILPTERRWAPWWVGGLAGAALATAATLVVVGTVSDRAQLYPEPGPGRTSPPASPAPAARPVLDVLPPPLELRGPHRGPGGGEAPTLRLEPGARFAQLALPEFYLADSVTIDLRITGPDGRARLDARRPYGELLKRRTLLFGDPDTVLATGTYRLVVTAPFEREQVVGDFRFDVVR